MEDKIEQLANSKLSSKNLPSSCVRRRLQKALVFPTFSAANV
jgi:hypothetical protein